MTDSWTISVSGRVYGPYTLAQMQGFHGEGRLADHSMVARAGEDKFHPAREDAEFSALFAAPVAPTPQGEPHKFGRGQSAAEREQPTHYVIISEMKSRSIAGLEEEIFALGPAQRFTPQAWVLVSEASINTIRNALVQKLGKLDTLFIVDATHDKACWFNFGPEGDARVRALWQRMPELQVKRA
ncbi:MAG TPA: DUF4339 domain-containing protein [Rhizomicrobium sp.]|jgi:hypothetical protein|nr:DUF4339 domain-containing protein [Rhizomicrobium sp.]